jgi:hypothetical protein
MVALCVQAIWMTRALSISSRGLAPSVKAKLAFTAISQIPLFGSRAAAMSCWSEAATNALEAVPKAFLRRCHHSRACPGAEGILEAVPPFASLPVRQIVASLQFTRSSLTESCSATVWWIHQPRRMHYWRMECLPCCAVSLRERNWRQLDGAVCAGPIVRFARLARPRVWATWGRSERTNSWPHGGF